MSDPKPHQQQTSPTTTTPLTTYGQVPSVFQHPEESTKAIDPDIQKPINTNNLGGDSRRTGRTQRVERIQHIPQPLLPPEPEPVPTPAESAITAISPINTTSTPIKQRTLLPRPGSSSNTKTKTTLNPYEYRQHDQPKLSRGPPPYYEIPMVGSPSRTISLEDARKAAKLIRSSPQAALAFTSTTTTTTTPEKTLAQPVINTEAMTTAQISTSTEVEGIEKPVTPVVVKPKAKGTKGKEKASGSKEIPILPAPAPSAAVAPAPALAFVEDSERRGSISGSPNMGASMGASMGTAMGGGLGIGMLPAPEGSNVPAASRRHYTKKKAKVEGLMAYTSAFVPGLMNIKNPAGDFVQRDTNVEVFRQLSLARAKQEKAETEEARQKAIEAGHPPSDVHPLSHTLIIHPGSRNLKIGRASDFYPKEVPNCIARRGDAPFRGLDPPVPGSRAKRIAREQAEAREAKRSKLADGGDVEMDNDEDEDEPQDAVTKKIGYLRDYLRNKLRVNRLSTDYREGQRVNAFNSKVKPEAIPEHNDPYRFDWTEIEGKSYFIGQEALRLPPSSKYKVRYPILHRGLNLRDWKSPQLLLDDINLILQDSLRTELDIYPRDYPKYSVVLIVPDHGDRVYVQEMTEMLLGVMNFKEIAVHQESYTAIFSAGMSAACVVDIGAQSTSITCVDDGLVNQDSRVMLKYGGDDITAALVELLQRCSFPYKELDLAKSQEWLMMDNIKNQICTLEEHLVASTSWYFNVLRPDALTLKYPYRTYDENVLAPLCFFDTRIIDFEEKEGSGKLQLYDGVDDTLSTAYDEATAAMKACTTHLLPAPVVPTVAALPMEETATEAMDEAAAAAKTDGNAEDPVKDESKPPTEAAEIAKATGPTKDLPATNGTATPTETPLLTNAPMNTDTPILPPTTTIPIVVEDIPDLPSSEIIKEASHSPLDGAIAASLSMVGNGNENKVKGAANSILLIGGGSALKGLGAFLQERIPPLLRAKNFPVEHISIVPPPRNLNPRFVCWKGASVMCNLESLSDMWIRRDEWEAVGARSLKERCLFL